MADLVIDVLALVERVRDALSKEYAEALAHADDSGAEGLLTQSRLDRGFPVGRV